MKFSGNVGNGPMNKRLNFGGEMNHCLDIGIVFRIRHYWEIRNQPTALRDAGVQGKHIITSPARDRQPRQSRQPVMVNDIATVVRRALAEVCTVPVLLVQYE